MSRALLLLLLALGACQDPETVDRGWMTDDLGRPALWGPGRLPQRLILSPHLTSWTDDIEQGASFWGDVVGREVFEYAGHGFVHTHFAADTIYITLTDGVNPSATRYQERGSGRLIAMEVHLPPGSGLSPATRLVIAKHELGHCLGLDDDTLPGSIMHGKVDKQLQNLQGLDVTDADRRRVQNAYQADHHHWWSLD